MPYWKDAPSVKPEVFLSLSAPFRLLRADHYRLGRVSCYNIETSAGLAYAAPAMRWRAAETFDFCAFLRLEDLRRSSEAG